MFVFILYLIYPVILDEALTIIIINLDWSFFVCLVEFLSYLNSLVLLLLRQLWIMRLADTHKLIKIKS